MAERKLNLEEILKINLPSTSFESDNWLDLFERPVVKNWVLRAMKEACKQAIELAAENAECKFKSKIECTNLQLESGFAIANNAIIVDKQSILNTINQIE